MLPTKDLLLLTVSFSTIFAGVLLPGFGAYFQPYPLHCMIVLLFVSFLSIDLSEIWKIIRHSGARVVVLLLLKLIVLPVAVFFLFRLFLPEYALAVLLLCGMSTAVMTPYFAQLLQANSALVFVMLVASSMLVPVTLPALVKILLERIMDISFLEMMRLLCIVIFVPIILARTTMSLAPAVGAMLEKTKYPVSLLCFAVTNLGIFSQYSDFFRSDPTVILTATLVATGLAGLLFLAGILVSRKEFLDDQLAVIISVAMTNSVLVIVFSSRFFGPLEPTVAAMSSIPFFALIVPLRLFRAYRLKSANPK